MALVIFYFLPGLMALGVPIGREARQPRLGTV